MRKTLAAVVLVLFLTLMIYLALNLRPFGDPPVRDMDKYFIENAQRECSTNNVVTSIVFDYRGFDTLGEATVLFTAVAGTLAVLRSFRRMENIKVKELPYLDRDMSVIVRTISNIVAPIILTFGFYIILHGHLTPGGGFQGGAVIATGIALLIVANSPSKVKKMFSKSLLNAAESLGAIGFISVAFLGIMTATFFYNVFANSGFLFGNATESGVNYGDLNTGGTLPYMNIFVGIKVLAGLSAVALVLYLLAKEGEKI